MKKTLVAITILLLAVFGAYWYAQTQKPGEEAGKTPPPEQTLTPITITSKEILEENYTGSQPVILGEGKLPETARSYIETLVTEFAAQADAEVPGMREEWGEDSGAASYNIEIGAKLLQSEQTRSIVITEYVYTGGAHGSSSYKALTASSKSGELLSLSDILKEGKKTAFTELAKKKLNGFRPSGSETPVVFPEDVADLSFDSFKNWALDNNDLILYFAQYEVGPGVLGAFELNIPRTELAEVLR
jgi:hypothetical protein